VLIEGKPVAVRTAMDAIRADIGFVTEDRKATGLVACRDITDNANYVSWLKTPGFFKGRARSLGNAKRMVDRLAIRCSGTSQLVANLSGGNQQKVALSKWLLSGAKVLVLDEPTRGVDVGAKAEIHQLMGELARQGVAIVMISSELPEILSASDRILVLHEGRITAELPRAEATEERIMMAATGQALAAA
jgi:ribose transport system ATP-binding protein